MKYPKTANSISYSGAGLLLTLVLLAILAVPVFQGTAKAASALEKSKLNATDSSARRCWRTWQGTYCSERKWNGKRWVNTTRYYPEHSRGNDRRDNNRWGNGWGDDGLWGNDNRWNDGNRWDNGDRWNDGNRWGNDDRQGNNRWNDGWQGGEQPGGQ